MAKQMKWGLTDYFFKANLSLVSLFPLRSSFVMRVRQLIIAGMVSKRFEGSETSTKLAASGAIRASRDASSGGKETSLKLGR